MNGFFDAARGLLSSWGKRPSPQDAAGGPPVAPAHHSNPKRARFAPSTGAADADAHDQLQRQPWHMDRGVPPAPRRPAGGAQEQNDSDAARALGAGGGGGANGLPVAARAGAPLPPPAAALPLHVRAAAAGSAYDALFPPLPPRRGPGLADGGRNAFHQGRGGGPSAAGRRSAAAAAASGSSYASAGGLLSFQGMMTPVARLPAASAAQQHQPRAQAVWPRPFAGAAGTAAAAGLPTAAAAAAPGGRAPAYACPPWREQQRQQRQPFARAYQPSSRAAAGGSGGLLSSLPFRAPSPPPQPQPAPPAGPAPPLAAAFDASRADGLAIAEHHAALAAAAAAATPGGGAANAAAAPAPPLFADDGGAASAAAAAAEASAALLARDARLAAERKLELRRALDGFRDAAATCMQRLRLHQEERGEEEVAPAPAPLAAAAPPVRARRAPPRPPAVPEGLTLDDVSSDEEEEEEGDDGPAGRLTRALGALGEEEEEDGDGDALLERALLGELGPLAPANGAPAPAAAPYRARPPGAGAVGPRWRPTAEQRAAYARLVLAPGRAGGPAEGDVIAEHPRAKIPLLREKARCLRPRQWLNDEAVNFYGALLQDRSLRVRRRDRRRRRAWRAAAQEAAEAAAAADGTASAPSSFRQHQQQQPQSNSRPAAAAAAKAAAAAATATAAAAGLPSAPDPDPDPGPEAPPPRRSAPRAHHFPTFFWNKLYKDAASPSAPGMAYNYGAVRRWTTARALRLAGLPYHASGSLLLCCDRAVVPIHVSESHWCCAVVDFRLRAAAYLDSLGGRGDDVLEALLRWVEDEADDKLAADDQRRARFADARGTWRRLHPRVPQQRNGCDCGVFASLFADRLGLGAAFDFDGACTVEDARVAMFACMMAGEVPLEGAGTAGGEEAGTFLTEQDEEEREGEEEGTEAAAEEEGGRDGSGSGDGPAASSGSGGLEILEETTGAPEEEESSEIEIIG